MPFLNNVLNWEPLSRTRRNHALEHATLQVLSSKDPNRRLAGYSDANGFWIMGTVNLEDLQQAVDEAQSRLRGGEARLAVHPYCGTNFVTTGLVAGAFGWLGMLGTGRRASDKLDRLPLVIMLTTFAMIMAQPLGPAVQARYTTQAELGTLQVTGITRYNRGEQPLHRVSTRF